MARIVQVTMATIDQVDLEPEVNTTTPDFTWVQVTDHDPMLGDTTYFAWRPETDFRRLRKAKLDGSTLNGTFYHVSPNAKERLSVPGSCYDELLSYSLNLFAKLPPGQHHHEYSKKHKGKPKASASKIKLVKRKKVLK